MSKENGKHHERRSLDLNAEQWAEMERLAEKLGTVAGKYAPNHGQPTWRVLVREIAEGKIKLERTNENDETPT